MGLHRPWEHPGHSQHNDELELSLEELAHACPRESYEMVTRALTQ